jgi:hypothetical protein
MFGMLRVRKTTVPSRSLFSAQKAGRAVRNAWYNDGTSSCLADASPMNRPTCQV